MKLASELLNPVRLAAAALRCLRCYEVSEIYNGMSDLPPLRCYSLEEALRLFEAKGNVVDAERVRGLISPRPIQT